MTKQLIGYIAWDFSANEPKSGTRRFKVWTTEKECRVKHAIHPFVNRYGVKPVFVEVDENV